MIPKKKLRKALTGKFGFEPVEGTRHEALAFHYRGKKVATTRFSRGSRSGDIGPSLLRMIARQIRLESPGALPTLYGMVECSESLANYLEKLKLGGFLD